MGKIPKDNLFPYENRYTYVDPENLRDFIAHIEHLGIQKLYLQLVIQDKEEEADEIIAQYDDYLFCYDP